LLFSSASGSAQPNISASQIEDIEITVPNKAIIEEFGKVVNPFFEKILENQHQIRTLTQLRDTLLPKLMIGAVSISGDCLDLNDGGVLSEG
jgi:type I restriction enzyme S subunit